MGIPVNYILILKYNLYYASVSNFSKTSCDFSFFTRYNSDKFALRCCISVICDLFQWFKSPHENIFRKQQLFIHIDVQFSTTPLTSQGPAGDQYL